MKRNKIMMALLMGIAVVACTPKAAEETAAEAVPDTEIAMDENTPDESEVIPTITKQEIKDVSYLLGINFGSMMSGANFGDLDYAQITKGMKEFLNAEGTPNDPDFVKQFRVDPNTMGQVINGYIEKRNKIASQKNMAEGQAFLEKNAKKNGVITTASGLQYEVLAKGNGKRMAAQDTAYVFYKGTFIDGKVFDEVKTDAEPIPFHMGSAIPGFEEALMLVEEGGRIKAYLPSELAYGVRGQGMIEPNSVLCFEISLDRIGSFIPAEAAE